MAAVALEKENNTNASNVSCVMHVFHTALIVIRQHFTYIDNLSFMVNFKEFRNGDFVPVIRVFGGGGDQVVSATS